MIIAIDGTSGSGKSTAARLLAKELNIELLNTGSLYRSITLECLNLGIDLNDEEKVIGIVKKFNFSDIDLENLYTENISSNVPIVASIPKVREFVRKYQYTTSLKTDIIVEGRDIGTIVFPQAEFKFFIMASAEKRAWRRYLEFEGVGEPDTYEEILANIKDRDYKDIHRSHSPLVAAKDSFILDTSNIGIKKVLEILLNHIKDKQDFKSKTKSINLKF